MKKTLLLILFSVAIATLNAQTQKNAWSKEYTRPAFAFTASNSMYLEKISIDKNCTELYFSATEPGKLPDLETPIYLVAGNNRIPYIDAFVSENKDSVKLVFRALPASAVTFDLIGFDKGWYGIRTDGKGYISTKQDKCDDFPADEPLPEYEAVGDTAYVVGNIIGFVPDEIQSYIFVTQDAITGLEEVKIEKDSIDGDFVLYKQGLHNHAVYSVFSGDISGDFWFFPGYRTTVTVDLPSAMAKKYKLEGYETVGKEVVFDGPVGDLSQVLWDLTHMDWQTVIGHESVLETSFEEFAKIQWDTMHVRKKKLLQSEVYNNRQRQLASLFAQKEYIRNIISYPQWLKRSLQRARVANVDSVYNIKIKEYTLKDTHSVDIELFDKNSNAALWLIRDATILPYAVANGLTDNPVARWMSDFEYSRKICRQISAEPFDDGAVQWDSVAPQFIEKVRGFNRFIRNEKARMQAEMKDKVKVCSVPDKYQGSVIDYVSSQFEGKILLIDCWATWCGPCKAGIRQIKDYKTEMEGKPVVFVYLTNGSSPYQEWSNTIMSIPGYHYRLSDKDWNTIPNINGIPRYFLCDENGKVIMDVEGWGKNSLERFKSKINELLKEMEL